MGLDFGHLPIRIRRILYYGLSPMEQKPWAKAVSLELVSLVKRTASSSPTYAPAFLGMLCIMIWAEGAHKRAKRKDPKVYENDT